MCLSVLWQSPEHFAVLRSEAEVTRAIVDALICRDGCGRHRVRSRHPGRRSSASATSARAWVRAGRSRAAGESLWRLRRSVTCIAHRGKPSTTPCRLTGVLASNPALLAKLPKETRRVTRSMWTAQDLDVFRESISGHRLHAFYRVAAFTGARTGEVLHLRWSDLDLEDIIRFEGSTGVVDGERIDGTTKGGRS
jgi:integrase